MSGRIVVAISGQVSAGKTTAGYFLRDRGFGYTRISWAIKQQLVTEGAPLKDGDDPSRRQFQNEGIHLHRQRGQAWLCAQALALLQPYAFHFVVDGLRWEDDVAFFRRRYGPQLIHLHIEAPLEERRRRFRARNKDVSFEETDSHEVEREAPLLGGLSDRIIANDKRIDEFYAKIEQVLKDELHAR